MRVKAIKHFVSTVYGNITEGQVLDPPEGLAKHMISNGLAKPEADYSTKVVREVPTDAGEANESTSSPADQASPKQTRKKRGKRKGELSPSTVPSDSAETQTRSTLGITSGGRTTGTTGEDSED